MSQLYIEQEFLARLASIEAFEREQRQKFDANSFNPSPIQVGLAAALAAVRRQTRLLFAAREAASAVPASAEAACLTC